jgi:hypothetical protein
MPKALLEPGQDRAALSPRYRVATASIAGTLAVSMLAVGIPAAMVQAQVGRGQTSVPASEEAASTRASDRFVLGRRPFTSSSSWNSPVPPDATFVPVKWPASTGYNYGVTWNNYSPGIYASSHADPVVTVTYPAGWGYKGGQLSVRMPLAADGAAGTDGELIVIDGSTVHNFWQFVRLGPTSASARSYGAADALTGTGWGTRRPVLGAGIVAAGASQFAGLLVQAETDAGEIDHALQLSVDAVLVKPGFTGEAISGDGKSPDGILQIGDRLAIAPATSMPPGLSPLGQKVFRAYQRYGVFVVDVAGGSTNLRAQANAYDRETMALLKRDVLMLTPMLQSVR